MSIELKCTGCQRTLRVADEHAGKRARCPECNEIVNVPAGPRADTIQHPDPNWSATAPAQWFMKTPEGQVYGPVDRRVLDSWCAEGRVSADCWIRPDNSGDWLSADRIFPSLNPKPKSTIQASGSFGAAATTANPFADGRNVNTAFLVPHRGGLILALSLCGLLLSCPPFGIAAWVMGTHDLREMRSGRMDPSGLGITQAGQILGMIQLVLCVVGIALFLFMVLLSAALG